MKTAKVFEIEIERFNVTPAQFLAYLRSMQKKHPEMANDFSLEAFKGEGWSIAYNDALPSERPCESERITDKPFEKQTYLRNFDGSTYNEIIEFEFDDDRTGHGYYYTVQIDVADEDVAANTMENISGISKRREAKAAHQVAKAQKFEQEADEAEIRGYTAKWWIDAKRLEARSLRKEASDSREAIAAAALEQPSQEAVEAPQGGATEKVEDHIASCMNAETGAHAGVQSATRPREHVVTPLCAN